MKHSISLNWRLFIFVVAMACGFLLLLIRLIDVQIVKGTTFLNQADDNRFFSVRIPPERGVILDRYGEPLTYNVPRYYRLENSETIYSDRTVITPQEALHLKATDSAHLVYELERQYLFPKSLSHVLGYTGLVTADNLLDDTTLFPDDKIGKLGLERQFDSYMRGKSGYDIYEINAMGQRQRLVETKPGKAGESIFTTLDPYLAEVAMNALGEQTGSVVILDGQNAEVLAMVTTPSYDSSVMSKREIDPTKEQERKQMIQGFFDDPRKVFFNRAISGVYPPGSVFKLVTALIGLEEGAFDPQTTVEDEGVLKVGEYTYANWFFTQYGGKDGTINLQRAISRSNDIYFYKAAEWLGPQKLADGARLMGLGKKTGIDVSGEEEGLVPDPKWKEEIVGERWFLGNTYHFGIGQSDLLVTPLQVAHFTQALADMGTLCQPYLVRSPSSLGSERKICTEIGVHEDNLQVVLKGMLDACSDGGTAFPFFEHNRTYRNAEEANAYRQLQAGAIACKTGTAEFGGVDENGYRKTHGWFTTIVDTEPLLANITENKEQAATVSAEIQPEVNSAQQAYNQWKEKKGSENFPKRLVIVAMVESDEKNPYKEGSRDAGPVVRKIVDWLQGKDISEVEVIEGQGE